MEPEMERPFDYIRRLQQQVDYIQKSIDRKRERISTSRIRGPLLRHIEKEIANLEAVRNVIIRKILQLKKIHT